MGVVGQVLATVLWLYWLVLIGRLVFGLHGTIERVTNKVFLLSPANVEVGAEARAQLAQTGFFNQS